LRLKNSKRERERERERSVKPRRVGEEGFRGGGVYIYTLTHKTSNLWGFKKYKNDVILWESYVANGCMELSYVTSFRLVIVEGVFFFFLMLIVEGVLLTACGRLS
jgi:hypothetical protein